jgi:hypothetical protein
MTSPATPEPIGDELRDKLKTWLRQEGYPLEFSTADGFREAGFSVLQGEYAAPTKREPRRELPRKGRRPMQRGRGDLQ